MTFGSGDPTCGTGVGASMQLWVNGSPVRTRDNTPQAWTVYSQAATLTGDDDIGLVFTNDCWVNGNDRNLLVDYSNCGASMESGPGPGSW